MSIAKTTVERVTAVGVMGNVLLVVLKLFAGLAGRSSAMVSDAFHSLSDVLATFVAYLGATFSEAPEDKTHPYGHEQFEDLAAIVIGLTLLATGATLCYHGVEEVWRDVHLTLSGDVAALERRVPTTFPLIAAIVSIVVKEAMFWYTIIVANKLNSPAFRADAWHHRTDAFSSIGSLVGIVGARMGFTIMDPIASVVISFFILWVAVRVLRNSASLTVDTSCGEEFEKETRELILAIDGVDRLDLVRTRKFGSRVYVETEISVDGTKSLFDAHRIAHEVHNAVETRFPVVKHIMVHVNPTQLEDADAVLSSSRPGAPEDAKVDVS